MHKAVRILKKQFPKTVYIPEGFPEPGEVYSAVKPVLAQSLAIVQKQKCPVCDLALNTIIDPHEGIVTKGDVQGWPKPWRIIIINIYNTVLVHRDCHRHGLREFFWEYKCELFGEDEIRKWYYSLPFKTFPREFGRLE